MRHAGCEIRLLHRRHRERSAHRGDRGEKLMPIALELGGKSPHVVFADANLEAAAAAVADGIFEASRTILCGGFEAVRGTQSVIRQSAGHRSASAPQQPQARSAGCTGSPARSDLLFCASRAVERYVSCRLRRGRQDRGGRRAPAGSRLVDGAYYLPTVVTGLDQRCNRVPAGDLRARSLRAAVRRRRGSCRAGERLCIRVGGGIWTADYQRAWRVARRLDAGTVWINNYKQLSIATPFGGFKDSGFGREKGIGGLRLYQQVEEFVLGTRHPPLA